MRRALLAFWDSGIFAKNRKPHPRSSAGASSLLRLHLSQRPYVKREVSSTSRYTLNSASTPSAEHIRVSSSISASSLLK